MTAALLEMVPLLHHHLGGCLEGSEKGNVKDENTYLPT